MKVTKQTDEELRGQLELFSFGMESVHSQIRSYKDDVQAFDITNQYLKEEVEKFQSMTIDFRGKVSDQVMDLKRSIIVTISEINSSITKMLSQHDYYISRVDKQKIYLDKVYTTSEWLTMEKRKLKQEVEILKDTSVRKQEYNQNNFLVNKDIRLLKNRYEIS